MTDTPARPKAYTDESRRAAVDSIAAEKLTVAEAARRLGVHPEVLREWKRRHAPAAPAPAPADAAPAAENRRLRGQVRQLTVGRESLNKAATFFARESAWGSPSRASREAPGPSRCCAATSASRRPGATPGGAGRRRRGRPSPRPGAAAAAPACTARCRPAAWPAASTPWRNGCVPWGWRRVRGVVSPGPPAPAMAPTRRRRTPSTASSRRPGRAKSGSATSRSSRRVRAGITSRRFSIRRRGVSSGGRWASRPTRAWRAGG